MDPHNHWWTAGKEYNYDVKTKLLKEGCREVHRSLIECQNRPNSTCENLIGDYETCSRLHNYLLNKPK